MVKIEFSGRKAVLELVALFLTYPFAYLFEKMIFKWLNIPDHFLYTLIGYMLLWWFFTSWARFYVWVQNTDWSS